MTQDYDKLPQAMNTLPAFADPAAIAAAEKEKARIQAAYQIALYKPRRFMDSRQRILEACKRPEFAAKVEYNKPIGKGVKGPSIRLAELALREWQNVMIETQTIYEDDEKRRILVRTLDLETNTAYGTEFQINKTVERKNGEGRDVIRKRTNSKGEEVFIVLATEDEILNKVNALVSKAIRTNGLRLIPQDVIEDALQIARETLRGNIKDPKEGLRKMCDYFASNFGITVPQIEEYLGHPADTATWEELDDLRGIANALKDGEAKWSDYVQPKDKAEKTAEGTASKAEELKNKLANAKAEKIISCPDGTPADMIKCAACQTKEGCPNAPK
jgi:hypothetical protein